MADVKPFKGLRPSHTLAHLMASVPYDVVSTDEAKELARNNPYSLLHVTKPEIDLPSTVSPYNDVVYQQGHKTLQHMIENGWLQQDTQPCYYLYRLTMDGHAQTGFVLAASTQDYLEGRIRKHELTRTDKEEDRVKHLSTVQAHTGKVFLLHPEHTTLDSFAQEYTQQHKPHTSFTAEDGVQHQLWVVDNPTHIQHISDCFASIPVLYIADGHHRAASAARVASHTDNKAWHSFLAVSFPHTQCRIWDYNRVVKDLNGLDEKTFLKKISEHYHVTQTFQQPSKLHQCSMYLANTWYHLQLKTSPSHASPIENLDAYILQNTVLGPILGISDPRKDTRIDFIGGIRGYKALEKRIHEGWAVAFWMHPTSVSELMDVANADAIMPPKSTWFEPKLRDGIVVYKP
jgi:uncharacterized protein (DUF1015 family)